MIIISISFFRLLNVSPDLIQDKDLIEKKTVDNGFEYVLDAKGNVMKDTSGNDIKIKKYKEIQCTVIESHQQKDCNITGEIEFSCCQSTVPAQKTTHCCRHSF